MGASWTSTAAAASGNSNPKLLPLTWDGWISEISSRNLFLTVDSWNALPLNEPYDVVPIHYGRFLLIEKDEVKLGTDVSPTTIWNRSTVRRLRPETRAVLTPGVTVAEFDPVDGKYKAVTRGVVQADTKMQFLDAAGQGPRHDEIDSRLVKHQYSDALCGGNGDGWTLYVPLAKRDEFMQLPRVMID